MNNITYLISYRRSVCIDYLYYNKDGSMKRVIMTTEGVKR
jgi:hypothetical protein